MLLSATIGGAPGKKARKGVSHFVSYPLHLMPLLHLTSAGATERSLFIEKIRDEFSRCVRVKKFISSVFKKLKQRLFLDLPWRESLIWKGVGGGCVHEFQCPDLFSSPFLNKSFG